MPSDTMTSNKPVSGRVRLKATDKGATSAIQHELLYYSILVFEFGFSMLIKWISYFYEGGNVLSFPWRSLDDLCKYISRIIFYLIKVVLSGFNLNCLDKVDYCTANVIQTDSSNFCLACKKINEVSAVLLLKGTVWRDFHGPLLERLVKVKQLQVGLGPLQ